MVKIKNSHRKLINEPLKSRIELHVGKMKDVALYAPYKSVVLALDALMPTLGAAIISCKLGGTDRTIAKNKIQAEAILAIDDLIRQLEAAANAKGVSQEEGVALVTGAGFEVVENKGRTATVKKVVTYLDAPTGLTATDEKKQGAVRLEWEDNDDAITFLIFDVDADGRKTLAGVSEAPPAVLTGFPSKANRTFVIYGVSNGTVMSDSSESVTVHIS